MKSIDHCLVQTLNQASIAQAARYLQNGLLVVIPTETVYGLAADARQEDAVRAIFTAKGRPRNNPLIVHCVDQYQAETIGVFDARARLLSQHFWPGPLTIIVPQKNQTSISRLAMAGLETIALRVPGHGPTRRLLQECRCPLAAPSANTSGTISPTSSAAVNLDHQQNIAMILDDGPCSGGVESTIIDLSDHSLRILRPGMITQDAIESVLGQPIDNHSSGNNGHPRAPGQSARHYAPNHRLILNQTSFRLDEAALLFGPPPIETLHRLATLNLSPSGDWHQAAFNLYPMLQRLDRLDCRGIVVMPIPNHDLGVAINDRLRRASAPPSS